MSNLYPWLVDTWQHWQASLRNDRFANVTLLSAQEGLGAEELVKELSSALMCINYDDQACGFCHSCDLMASGNHPDFHVIAPEKQGKSITVDKIRRCNQLAQESSQLSRRRLIVIESAQQMNESASNALLKTLESASPDCFFLLAANEVNKILPTILSRSQQWRISTPLPSESAAWLLEQAEKSCPLYAMHINGGAPLKALQFVQQGGVAEYQQVEHGFLAYINSQGMWQALAKQLAAQEMSLTWLWYLLSDAQKVHFGLNETHFTPSCQALSGSVSYDALYAMTKSLGALMQELSSHAGLNSELLIADWLIKCKEETCS
ncbi:DNA polymerase III subunit delta' [Vibrio profundum]|uniref:DNA polymerase III subunit delta' C-terminal domain-containing protein n=1 Tax=Vibrio profundum TaxID=2910247 RepID=UPI003D150E5F